MITSQNIIILSTLDGKNNPQTRAMINIHNKNIAPHLNKYFNEVGHNKIYFTTNTSSAKILQIKRNKKSSAYIFDGVNFEGILLLGNIKEVKSRGTKDIFWDRSWLAYYPSGKNGGDFSLLEFAPRAYKYYGQNFYKTSGKF